MQRMAISGVAPRSVRVAASVALVLVLLVAGWAALPQARAATPDHGTLTPTSGAVTWSEQSTVSEPAGCSGDGDFCDRFSLTIAPAGGTYTAIVTISTDVPANDYDVRVLDAAGNLVGDSANQLTPPEVVKFEALAGSYTVEVTPFAVAPGTSYNGRAELEAGSATGPTPTRQFFLTSANGGFAQDLATDPTATNEGRAPTGSALVTTAPTGTTDALADSGAAGFTDTSPSWHFPEAIVAESLCLDMYVSRPPRPPGINGHILFDSGLRPAGGAVVPNETTSVPAIQNQVARLRTIVKVGDAGQVAIPQGGGFVISALALDHQVHYGAAAVPSNIIVNPRPGDCGETPAAATSSERAPRYLNFAAPGGTASSAGEPTIGVRNATNNAFFIASTETLKIGFDDSTSPPTAHWTDVSAPQTNQTTLDPIIEVNPRTGRVVASQLAGVCSIAATTDDEGETWQPSSGCPQPHGTDHQSIGSGPYPASVPEALRQHPEAFYYCSQEIEAGFCGRSDDGGRTFGPSSTSFTPSDCEPLHGHLKVAPDGTVYVPNNNCNGQQGVSVSTDGGLTWVVRKLPDSTVQGKASHPAVAVGADGTVYYGYESSTGRPAMQVSRDRGLTWTTPVDVGAPFGIRNADFPVVVAGDGDRAAFAFIGTTLEGDSDAADFGMGATDFTNEWHLYIAHTYDRGATWVTQDVTPTDPVQRGCVSNSGTTSMNNCRNLLDFNGITVDRDGRVLVAWSDGCTGACVTSTAVGANTRTDSGVVTRLVTGKGLFSAFDGDLVTGSAVAAPCTSADPSGDAESVAGQAASNQPEVDVLETGVAKAGDKVTFRIRVADLAAITPGNNGKQFDWTFALGDHAYLLQISDLSGLGPSFSVTKDGVAVADVAGRYDDNTIVVDAPASALTPGEDGQREVTSSALLARPVKGLLLTRGDTAGPCDVDLNAAATGGGGGGTTTTTSTPSGSSTTSTTASTQTTERPSGTTGTNGAATPHGYSLVGEDGSLYAFGSAKNLGDMRGKPLNAPIIGVAYAPGGEGYWLVAKDGGIFTFGSAEFHGSMGGSKLNSPVIGMTATATGKGYWLFAADGGIFTFGDAEFFGSMGDQKLNGPVLNMEPLASGRGYWLVAADGGIFSFGRAQFFGSMGDKQINQPVFDMTSTDVDKGYWLVARDGGVFSFGDAEEKFFGSAVSESPAPKRVIGMDATPDTQGYWIADATGSVYRYGDAKDLGDRAGKDNPAPMVAFSAVPG